MSFIDEFADMMPDTITITPGSVNFEGDWVASGEVISDVPCRVEGKTRMVRDDGGNEVVSGVQVIVGGDYDLTTRSHRYTIPERYSPNEDLEAISVDRIGDELGESYEVLYFP